MIITGNETILASFLAAILMNSTALLMFSCLLGVTNNCINAVLNS
jgi:hypothetical protein